MPGGMIARLSQAYGTRLQELIGDAVSLRQLGRYFGGDLYEAELTWLRDREFAQTAEDVLFRRTKLGLTLSGTERRAVERWFA
jgi:glycerol-3-phosphate dehydrogenase